MIDPAIAAARRDERETVVSDYVCRFSGGAAPAPVHVRIGSVSHEIARFAREVSATVIVVGSTPRRRLHRTVSGEPAARVLQSVDCPVLSVPPAWTSLPRTAIAAVDFGPASVRAAQAALLLLADDGTLVLTQVVPPLMPPAALSSPVAADPAADAHVQFDRLRDAIRPFAPKGASIETRLVTGDPADALLDSMAHVGAELIAVGTRGAGLVGRLFLGSVASSVLHGSDGAVLAAPPPPPNEALELTRQVTGTAISDRGHGR